MASSVTPVSSFTYNYAHQSTPIYELFVINGERFAVFLKTIASISDDGLHLDMSDWNVVIMAPITAHKDVTIRGKTVAVLLSTLESVTDRVNLYASGKLILLGATIKGAVGGAKVGDKGVFLGSIIPRHFEKMKASIVKAARDDDSNEALNGILNIHAAVLMAEGKDDLSSVTIAESFAYLGIPFSS